MNKELEPKNIKDIITSLNYKCDRCGYMMLPIYQWNGGETIGAKCDNCLSNLFL